MNALRFVIQNKPHGSLPDVEVSVENAGHNVALAQQYGPNEHCVELAIESVPLLVVTLQQILAIREGGS